MNAIIIKGLDYLLLVDPPLICLSMYSCGDIAISHLYPLLFLVSIVNDTFQELCNT